MLEDAVKLDPNYAVAYAQLGWAYTWLGRAVLTLATR